MQIQVGFELVYELPQPTPIILALSIHYSRASDIVVPDHLRTEPSVPIHGFRDEFGNWCHRIVAPAGRSRIWANGVVHDAGEPDAWVPGAEQHLVERLPEEALIFLKASRYCETDRLTDAAWKMFSATPLGWARVQSICDFVHHHVQFGYEHADPTKTACDVLRQRLGVCRDFAHLAIAFCRCLNIPARYCTGYLGDIGTPPPYPPGDFAAWFEAYLGGEWRTFDPRNNTPRIGRVLVARGRDAADVALTTTFGPSELRSFRVWADQVPTSP